MEQGTGGSKTKRQRDVWGWKKRKKWREKIENERFKRGKERSQTGIETYSVGVCGNSGVEGWINILPFTEWQGFSSLIYPLGRQKERSRAGPAILTLPLYSFYTTILPFISPPALLPLALHGCHLNHASLIVLMQPLTLCLFLPLFVLSLPLLTSLSLPLTLNGMWPPLSPCGKSGVIMCAIIFIHNH